MIAKPVLKYDFYDRIFNNQLFRIK